MKEAEFEKELKELGYENGLIIPNVYYMIDENGDVVLDEESMGEDFDEKMREIRGILE